MWTEPVRGAPFPSVALGLSGVEQLRLFLSGRAQLPPLCYLTGLNLTEVGVGSATFVLPITRWLETPQGLVTGGVLAILADAPLGSAIHTTLAPATPYTTTELSINMVRPVPKGGQLSARGRLVHGGRQLGLSEAFITDAGGRLIAHATSRCMIFPQVPDVPPPPAELLPVPVDEDGWVPPWLRPLRGEVLAQEVFAKRGGLEVMQAIISGELPLPPVAHLLATRPIHAQEGSCAFSLRTSAWLTSPLGTVQGGVTACLADFALGGAVQTTVPAGSAIAPTDLRVQFLRPVPADGREITARATVVHRGRGLAAARAEVTNDEGKLVALANASALILPGRRADLADARLSDDHLDLVADTANTADTADTAHTEGTAGTAGSRV